MSDVTLKDELTEVLEKIDESLRCDATTSCALGGAPDIECYLPRHHRGLHRTKDAAGNWSWEF